MLCVRLHADMHKLTSFTICACTLVPKWIALFCPVKFSLLFFAFIQFTYSMSKLAFLSVGTESGLLEILAQFSLVLFLGKVFPVLGCDASIHIIFIVSRFSWYWDCTKFPFPGKLTVFIVLRKICLHSAILILLYDSNCLPKF